MAKKKYAKKSQKEMPKQTLRERLADKAETSKEITLNLAKITIMGTRELSIENYGGIAEYSENSVLINAKPSAVKITGSFLEIAVVTKELLYIKGIIKKVAFADVPQKKGR